MTKLALSSAQFENVIELKYKNDTKLFKSI